jgi:hypothetical protein
MKSKFIIGVLITLATTILISWRAVALSEDKPVSFSIVVTQTDKGLEMKCQKGCAWKTLTYACGGKVPCSAIVDERGVHSAGSKEAK